jgi:hypothetical protein
MTTKNRKILYKPEHDDGDLVGPTSYLSGSDMILLHPNGKVGLTGDGGLAIKLTNKTNVTSQVGWGVFSSTSSDGGYELRAPGSTDIHDTIGFVHESVAANQSGWVVVSGIANVMVIGACKTGDWFAHSAQPGRVTASVDPSGLGALDVATHFNEIGHCLSTLPSGSNLLAKACIHFN